MLHSGLLELPARSQPRALTACAQYLVQFEFAHEQLLKAVAGLAAVTGEPVPCRERYTATRCRIVKASRARLELWEVVRAHLFQQVGGPTRALLFKLAAENIELREAVSAIIARWSSEAIESDWGGYCEAARQVRWKQMSIIRHERRDLLPILQRLGQGLREV